MAERVAGIHIQGQNVGDRIRRAGPFTVPAAVELGVQALQGLEAIHSTGVLHRVPEAVRRVTS